MKATRSPSGTARRQVSARAAACRHTSGWLRISSKVVCMMLTLECRDEQRKGSNVQVRASVAASSCTEPPSEARVTAMTRVLVIGDANPDLILTGDVVPRFGQEEQLLDTAQLLLGGSAAIT